MRTVSTTFGLVLATLVCTAFTSLTAQVKSTFDETDEGWILVSLSDTVTKPPLFSPTAGHPGGAVAMQEDATQRWFWLAPLKFIGDNSAAYDKFLVYNLRIEQGETDFQLPSVSLSGGGGITLVQSSLPGPPNGEWAVVAIRLNETADWHVGTSLGPPPTADEFKAVLGDLSSMLIRGRYRLGPELTWLDNVILGADFLGAVGERVASSSVSSAYPNPLSSGAVIRYTLASPAGVTLRVFDNLGRQVATLVDGPQEAGEHAARFDGAALPPGVYRYRLIVGDLREEHQIVIAR